MSCISKKHKENHLSKLFLAEKRRGFSRQAHVLKVVGSNPASVKTEQIGNKKASLGRQISTFTEY